MSDIANVRVEPRQHEWNVRQAVVCTIQAGSAVEAQSILARQLDDSGFATYADDSNDAFHSEDCDCEGQDDPDDALFSMRQLAAAIADPDRVRRLNIWLEEARADARDSAHTEAVHMAQRYQL